MCVYVCAVVFHVPVFCNFCARMQYVAQNTNYCACLSVGVCCVSACMCVCVFHECMPVPLCALSTSFALAHSLINNPRACWMELQRSIAVYCGVVFVWPWSQWFLGDGSIINLQLIHGANLTFTATLRTERQGGRERDGMERQRERERIVEKAREKRKGGGRVRGFQGRTGKERMRMIRRRKER